MTELVVSDLALRYGEAEILKHVSFRLPSGTIAALLGPSGSGKTTLLRAVAGLETPSRGTIRIGDKVLFDAGKRIDLPAEARGLGLVFQSYALWPHRTVFDNVAYGLKLRQIDPPTIKTRVEAVLARIGLADLAARYPHQLSGGQQQRAALARALVYEPSVILLDEPLSNLDAKLREEARAWLRQLIHSAGLSALMVTHDQTEAMAIADRITLLNAGSVEQDGPPTDLYRQPRTLFAAEFMGTNNRLEGTVVEQSGTRAVLDVGGVRVTGQARGDLRPGEPATGIVRIERMQLGGGPGPNRILMKVSTQMFLGERWEAVFATDAFTARVHGHAPLKYEAYHVEFPADALWVFQPSQPAAVVPAQAGTQ
jgi:iron(III) transport system ATP-binding protein